MRTMSDVWGILCVDVSWMLLIFGVEKSISCLEAHMLMKMLMMIAKLRVTVSLHIYIYIQIL